MRVALVCVGAGSGSRFGGDKLAQLLAGRPVLEWSLAALTASMPGAPLVVVVAAERLDSWRQRLGSAFPAARWVAGGVERQDSVRCGVEAVADLDVEAVCVHDAARPLVRPHDVRAVVAALAAADGAILCQRVADTVKRVDEAGVVLGTLPRATLRLALTPQVVRWGSYREAWRRVGEGGQWTDEAALLEAAGMTVRSVEARYPNPKLTTPEDLVTMATLAGGTGGGGALTPFAVGLGFDAHRYRAGRELRLCGLSLPGEIGLEGHSDADVALHAVTDAILGAVAEGDIGEHFPDADERWRDADSSLFVRHALAVAAARGLVVGNCDLTLVGERPRVAPHRQALRAGLAAVLGVAVEAVSVKATTTEGLGWTGRGEGLAALAVVLLRREARVGE